MKSQNTDLKRKLTLAQKQAEKAGVPEADVKKRISAAVAEAKRESQAVTIDPEYERRMREIQKSAERIVSLTSTGKAPAGTGRDRKTSAPVPKAPRQDQPVSEGLSGPEQRILDAIAWQESIGVDTPEQPAVAFLAGYRFGGGAFNNPRGRLNQRGFVQYLGKRIALTDEGRALANMPEAPASNEELHQRIMERLGGPEQRLLQPLIESYPEPMTNEDLAYAANYTPGAGAFNNPHGKLRGLGLIEYPSPGMVVARSLLFPMG